jgi:hypothetical protein
MQTAGALLFGVHETSFEERSLIRVCLAVVALHRDRLFVHERSGCESYLRFLHRRSDKDPLVDMMDQVAVVRQSRSCRAVIPERRHVLDQK